MFPVVSSAEAGPGTSSRCFASSAWSALGGSWLGGVLLTLSLPDVEGGRTAASCSLPSAEHLIACSLPKNMYTRVFPEDRLL